MEVAQSVDDAGVVAGGQQLLDAFSSLRRALGGTSGEESNTKGQEGAGHGMASVGLGCVELQEMDLEPLSEAAMAATAPLHTQ